MRAALTVSIQKIEDAIQEIVDTNFDLCPHTAASSGAQEPGYGSWWKRSSVEIASPG